MPIYEYQCDNCQHKLETIQKFSDPLLTECPECKQNKLRKLVSAAAFQLKGTGWYVTDFKDKKPAAKAGDGKSTDKDAAAKSGDAKADKPSSPESTGSKTGSGDKPAKAKPSD